MRSVILAILAIAACACQSSGPNPAREYIRLAVALGERDNQSLDYYYGPQEWVSDVEKQPPTFTAIAKQAQQLLSDAKGDFLRGQIRAVAARASMLAGKRMSFDEEAAVFFDLARLPQADAHQFGQARAEIAKLLQGDGSLAQRYDTFQRKLIIPEDRVSAVMDAALKECRARTVTHLDLPHNESVETQWIQDRPWSAFSLYKGGFQSRVQWNADFGLTVDRALELACHETYPGHHIHSVLVDQMLVQKDGKLEFLVQPTFSPQSFLSEALASYAADLAFTPEEREQFQRNVLYPVARINAADAPREFKIARLMEELEISQVYIARDFLDGRLEFTRASAKLEQDVLMVHAEETLKYLNQYRSYMLGYTVGRAMVRACFAKSSDAWQLLQRLLLHETSLSSCAG